VGEIISRINDAVKIRTLINDVFINLMVNVFIVIITFVVMFTYYWKLAFILLLSMPLYIIIYWISNKLNKKEQRRLMERSAELESQLVESLNSMEMIKRFSLEDHSNNLTEVKFITLLKSVFSSGLNNLFSSTSTDFISKAITIIMLWVGGSFVLSGALTTGELLSFYTLVGYFTGPITSLVGMNRVFQDAQIAADRLFEIMDLDSEIDKKSLCIEKEHLGDIRFESVNFNYSGRRSIFNDLSLTLPYQKTTAIVGESGSGKSTISSLLHNLYPIKSGNIFIGNYNLKYVANSSLRSTVGVVPQNVHLLAGNIIENICAGDYEPDVSRVMEICANLGIMGFIEGLPNGLDTYIGENGASLSGGQKQVLAIARILYRNPDVIIFDEATSSLDSFTEKGVHHAIEDLKALNRTIIIIAHRLSSVLIADKIIAMKEGKVIEEGGHAELYERRGYYFQLWQEQSFNVEKQYN
jgi:ATP-binding cassette subfamily B protein